MSISLYRKLYYRNNIKCRGISDVAHFKNELNELFKLNGTLKTTLDIEDHILKTYEFLNCNNIWLYHKDYLKFAEVVYEKIRTFSNRLVYNKILHFFPLKLCNHCKINTSNDQRLCKRCIVIRVILRKKIPSTLVKYFINIYSSSYDYECEENFPTKALPNHN